MSRAEELVAMQNHLDKATDEMRRAGLYDQDADYGSGKIAECVLDLLKVLYSQHHSGGSHGMVMEIFTRLADGKRLSPLTTESSEWMDVAEYQNGEALWQNRRQSTCFSLDGGKTYYDINEFRPIWKLWLWKWFGFELGYRGFTLHQSKDLLA